MTNNQCRISSCRLVLALPVSFAVVFCLSLSLSPSSWSLLLTGVGGERTEYCGVHTPESSPHGSPYSATGDSVHRQGVGRASTISSSSSQMSQSQQVTLGGHNHQQQSSANLVYAPQSQHQNHQSLKTESSSSMVDPSRNLPTPEMSPVEGNERDTFINGVRYFPGGVIRGGGQAALYGTTDPPINPVSQLIQRFSDGSTFLRNVCPPFRAREPSPPTTIPPQQMDNQVPNNTYELIRVNADQHLDQHWSCPVSEYEKMCNYSTYDKNELRESIPAADHHFNHDQMQQVVYSEMYRIPDQYMAVHHPSEMVDASGHQVHHNDSVRDGNVPTYPTDHPQSYGSENNYRSATVICENNNASSAELMAALAETREIIS